MFRSSFPPPPPPPRSFLQLNTRETFLALSSSPLPRSLKKITLRASIRDCTEKFSPFWNEVSRRLSGLRVTWIAKLIDGRPRGKGCVHFRVATELRRGVKSDVGRKRGQLTPHPGYESLGWWWARAVVANLWNKRKLAGPVWIKWTLEIVFRSWDESKEN